MKKKKRRKLEIKKTKKRKLNIKKTAQAIIDWANFAPLGRSIDIKKFNEKIKSEKAEDFLIEACNFCEVKPVYGD